MLGRKKKDGQTGVLVSNVPASAAEVGEHEALATLQRARRDRERALRAEQNAERLVTDAQEAYNNARLAMRRISDR